MPDVNPVTAWIENSLNRLTRRGCSLLFVFTAGDAGLGSLERHLGSDYDETLRRRGVAMQVVEGTDHTFKPLWSQDVLQGIVEEHLHACGFPVRESMQSSARASAVEVASATSPR